MVVQLPDLWRALALLLHVAGAIGAAALGLWLLPRRERMGGAGTPAVAALGLTALWSIGEALEPHSLATSLAESARNLAWLLVLYRFFTDGGRHDGITPVRPVLYALVFVELLHMGADLGTANIPVRHDVQAIVFGFAVMCRLLVAVGALVLVHNLYGGAPPDARLALRWPAAALAALWVFDLNLYTIGYLSGALPPEIAAMRGLATVALVCLFGVGAWQGSEALRLRPSRAVTFQTVSLLLIGVYLVAMVAVAQWLSYVGGDFARLIELCFLTLASAAAVLVLPSRRVRNWSKVVLTKHLFQHRYDYREEWLRFTRTIGNTGDGALPLGQRVVQAMGDIAGSPGGLLFAAGDAGELTLAARCNWSDIEVPASGLDHDYTAFLEREGFIGALDEIRDGAGGGTPRPPEWLLGDPRAWALVPLVHYERLVGVVVLARPQFARKLDWEDFDLLRVVGRQLASYLAENASQEALAEASRFDDFHRRIAFVMHDIKNLASQFSLLARNAELHAEKKAFRDDMIVTLRNSSEKLNALIARLSRYGSGGVEKLEEIAADDVARAVVARFAPPAQVVLAECQSLRVFASRHSLEQVLLHLIQNGIDASPSDSPVFVSLVAEGLNARFEVVDVGAGMSPDFVRTRLFKPFVSTKSGGFGIGAFEARELVRAMRGRLDVDSREGLGSRFVVRIPLFEVSAAQRAISARDQKVA